MKKIKKLQIFRLIIQILMFILLPGLFIMAFSGLKEIIGMLLAGNFNFIRAMPSLMEVIVVTVFTLLLGRMFCGWMCAFGAYNDVVYLISGKLRGTRFKVNEKVDSVLKSLKYIILFAIILASSVLGSSLFSSISPWDAFAQLPDFKGILTAIPIGLLLLLYITIGAFFIERFFCRYLCPLGAFFTLASKFSFFKVKKPTEKCGRCRICTDNCSMGLKLYKTESVHGGECINCLKCIEACPRRNTCVNVFGQDINSATASTVAIAAFTGIYGLNSLGGYIADQNNPVSPGYSVSSTVNTRTQKYSTLANNGTGSETVQSETAGSTASKTAASSSGKAASTGISTAGSTAATTKNGKYNDGTYTGTGTGFRGGTTEISVTISGGRITEIDTLATRDTPRFYNRCAAAISNEIISSQSASVDTVSGATYSSNGIIEAVRDALSKAV